MRNRTVVALLMFGTLSVGGVTVLDASGPGGGPPGTSSEFVGRESSRCVGVSGASAGDVAVVNITNTAANGTGYGALRSSDATPIFNRPTAQQYSSVNFAANTPPNPNLAFALVGTDGNICYDGAVADHHTILDLAAIIPAANITTFDPNRILDTRSEADPPTCDPSYPDFCIPPPPPQLSCADVGAQNFTVVGADPHAFDLDGDGIGCEPPPATTSTSPPSNCHPSYPDVCIPPPPPDLDCGDVPYRNFRVVGSDPHNFDGNNDGIACTT